jgi:hypothetical protein
MYLVSGMIKDINGKRYYECEGKLYCSVTTVLSIISKGKYFDKWLMSKTAEESKQISQDALDIGTKLHGLCEAYIKKEPYTIDPGIFPLFQAFLDWEKEYEPEYIHSELFLYSSRYKYAGTCDIVCKINGKMYVVDLKTSANFYNTMQLQLSAYAHAYREMYANSITNLMIVRIDKQTHKYYVKEYKKDFAIFHAALKIFNWQYPLKEDK